uniref:GRAM domain containing 4 n=1 Tax=Poecilia latipinna TaxID=48699 RepID=A0A3B3VJY7_9TELE
MLRRLDKIRFRSQRRDEFLDPTESPNTSDTECSDDVVMKTRFLPKEQEELREPELEQQTEAGPGSFLAGVQEEPKTDLNEVKGLLEIALLEKHFLQEELRKLKDESHIDSLKQELEKERCKRIELEQKVNDAIKLGVEDFPSQSPKPPSPQPSLKKHKETVYNSFLKWLYNRFGVYIEDFRFQPEETTVETEEPLSARRLTENMRRFKRGFRPVTNFMRNLSALSSWYSVYTSTIAFIVSPYTDNVSVFFFFYTYRKDLTVSEKFQLVLDVAQKAQVREDALRDCLCTILNLCVFSLFMWVQPELTQKLYVGLWVAFISSCLLPYQLLGFIIGGYAGIKFFIIDFIFKSCPKLRQRFDTPYIIWTNLPTDLQLKERSNTTLSRRVATAGGRGSVCTVPLGASREEDGGRYYSTKRGAFHEVFSLPESERPLPVCENGWRCCLINRDKKTPTDYIRHGVLYVTDNHCFFCFSFILLSSIQYKVLSVLPGSGMGISIATPTTQKPMVFGAMMHRDEAFDAIFSQHTKMVEKARAKNPET